MKTYPKIALRDANGFQFVHQEEIVCALADGNYTNIHLTNNRSVRVMRKLRAVSELLSKEYFIRVHRSHLINLQHIRSFEEVSVLMNNGKKLAVARQRKHQLIARFTQI